MAKWQRRMVDRLSYLRRDEPEECLRVPVRPRCLQRLRVDLRRLQ
jgi:hypothetical protein